MSVGAVVGAGTSVGSIVGGTVGAMVGVAVGAMVGTIVDAAVGPMVGGTVGATIRVKLGAMPEDGVGASGHAAVENGPGPLVVQSGGLPACTTASCGSHKAPPLLVHGLPPHHTQGSLAILTPLYMATDRPSRDLKHVPSFLM